MKNYVIGLDFGTLSGRCVVVDVRDGRELAESVFEYPHGVMDEALPDGTPLPPYFALQHPADYLEVLKNTVPDAMAKAGIDSSDVAAMGIDFTTCTLIPTYEDESFPPQFSSHFSFRAIATSLSLSASACAATCFQSLT